MQYLEQHERTSYGQFIRRVNVVNAIRNTISRYQVYLNNFTETYTRSERYLIISKKNIHFSVTDYEYIIEEIKYFHKLQILISSKVYYTKIISIDNDVLLDLEKYSKIYDGRTLDDMSYVDIRKISILPLYKFFLDSTDSLFSREDRNLINQELETENVSTIVMCALSSHPLLLLNIKL